MVNDFLDILFENSFVFIAKHFKHDIFSKNVLL